ncbi:MAG: hypothetical protein M0T84_05715 [Betaproteobacteria bacterium]|nr:hypothetical protein [Betaproteobacteria bacterium]
MTILNQLISDLHATKGRWPDVALESGVPVSTVRKIAQGVSADPGVGTVQKLLAYFQKHPVDRRSGQDRRESERREGHAD